MGTQSAAALTETRGGLAPAGPHLYVGIDIGRRAHVVAAIPQARMENDTWERAQARRTASVFPQDKVMYYVEPDLGWRHHVRGDVETFAVEGPQPVPRRTMSEPCVATVADRVQESLSSAVPAR